MAGARRIRDGENKDDVCCPEVLVSIAEYVEVVEWSNGVLSFLRNGE